MAESLFYTRPTRLNSVAHAKLCFTPSRNFEFARSVMAVPVMGVEFPLASRHYPIVFIQDPKGVLSAQAVLSLTKETNAFVDDKGQWTATYVPAFVRRYPFILVEVPGKPDDFEIAFDEASGCFDSKKGEPLFDKEGKPTTLLQGQLDFLQQFHAEHRRTQHFMATLKSDGLLGPYNVDIVRGADQARFAVRNALVVDEAKLAALSAERALTYLKSGFFALIYAHLISLQSFLTIANRTGPPASDTVPWWAK